MTTETPGPFAQEQTLKETFAREWLKTGDPFKAAMNIWPKDTGRALRAAWEYPTDPEMLEIRAKLLADEGEKSFLPTKEELARDVYSLSEQTTRPIEERLKGYRLYAEIMGYIDKPLPAKPSGDGTARPYNFVVMPYEPEQ